MTAVGCFHSAAVFLFEHQNLTFNYATCSHSYIPWLKKGKNCAPLPLNGVNRLFVRRLFRGTLAKNRAPCVPPGCPSKKFNNHFAYTRRLFVCTRKLFCVYAQGILCIRKR